MRSTPAILIALSIAVAGCSDEPDEATKPPVPPPITSIRSATASPLTPTETAGGVTPQPQQAVAAWRAAHSDVFSDLTASMGGIVDAIESQDLGTLQEACAVLDRDADPLRAALPSPDPGVTGALQAMADDVESAVRLCGDFTLAGASTADVERFTSLMADAQKQFDTANRLMDAQR